MDQLTRGVDASAHIQIRNPWGLPCRISLAQLWNNLAVGGWASKKLKNVEVQGQPGSETAMICYVPLRDVAYAGSRPVVLVRLSNGRKLRSTPDYLVRTAFHGFVPAGQLTTEHEVVVRAYLLSVHGGDMWGRDEVPVAHVQPDGEIHVCEVRASMDDAVVVDGIVVE